LDVAAELANSQCDAFLGIGPASFLRDTTPAAPLSPTPDIELPSYVVWGREMAGLPIPCEGRRKMTAGVVDGCVAVAARRREVGEEVGTGLGSAGILVSWTHVSLMKGCQLKRGALENI
jgi:hypothetical protein